MANRFWMQSISTMTKGLRNLQLRVLMSGTTPLLQRWQPPGISGGYGSYVNATAAVAGFGGPKGGAEGVTSVTRTNTGLWTIILQDNYQRLIDWQCGQQLAGGLAVVTSLGINSTLTDLTTAGGSTIAVAMLTAGSGGATPTAVDPADTTIVTINLLLSDSAAL